jgi:hypothetical protein
MIRLARSETERSMIRATATTEAKSRNQMGQPAAWTIANNPFPYRYFVASAPTVRHSIATRQVPQRSNPARRSVARAQRVVDSAISTKTCGQVCGLSMNGVSHARYIHRRVGGDQNLIRIFRRPNKPLRKRIGFRAGSCRRAAAFCAECGLV